LADTNSILSNFRKVEFALFFDKKKKVAKAQKLNISMNILSIKGLMGTVTVNGNGLPIFAIRNDVADLSRRLQ